MNGKFYLILAAAIVFNALANILLKMGMQGRSGLLAGGAGQALKSIALNPLAVSGILSFGLAFVLYSLVLTRVNLSVAYPVMTSLGLVIVSLVSVLLFREQLSALQAGGIALIIVGVWLVAG